MIIVFKPHATEENISEVSKLIEKLGYEPRIIRGIENTVIGAVGDEILHQSLEGLKNYEFIQNVLPIQKAYKLASREYHKEKYSRKNRKRKNWRWTHAGNCRPMRCRIL